jgi:hypothetical protein
LKPKFLLGYNLRGRRKLKRMSTFGLNLRPRPLVVDSRVKSNAGVNWVPDPDLGKGEASSEKAPKVILGSCFSAVESSCLVISGDNMIMGSVADSDEAVSATPSGKVADSSPAKSMLRCGFLRPVSLSPPEE